MLNSNVLMRKALAHAKLVQFSPPRSGSTLICNVLMDLFPQFRVRKKHNYQKQIVSWPVVATYRHPIDSVISIIQSTGKEISDESLMDAALLLEENGMKDLLAISGDKNALLLKYEDFYGNLGSAIDDIESFFGSDFSASTKALLIEKYNIDTVSDKVSALDSFDEYDKKTLWHGNHIGQFKGEPMAYKKILTDTQVTTLNNRFSDYMEKMNYPE